MSDYKPAWVHARVEVEQVRLAANSYIQIHHGGDTIEVKSDDKGNVEIRSTNCLHKVEFFNE